MSLAVYDTYTTKNGTKLPISDIKGKNYLEVKWRLVWFREDHPDWAIETQLLSVSDASCCARATVKDATGRVITTSHKLETKSGFADFIEKAETGAIGRALALLGYGTQFCADELDEGERLADSPVSKKTTTAMPPEGPNPEGGVIAPGDYRIPFGKKYKGKRLSEIPRKEIESYLDWLEASAEQKGSPLSDEARFFKMAVGRYLPTIEYGE